MMKNLISFSKIVAIIFVSFILLACQQPASPVAVARPALVMIVGEQESTNNMVLVGEVRTRYESSQGFRINGKIIERKVDVGAYVIKGQIIAKLDAADTNLTAAAAQADVRAAEANHALALAEVERQRTLFTKKFISASALDIREAELKTSSARLAQVKAQANVLSNQTKYTNLTADTDGVVAMISAEPGQVVQAGEAVVQIRNMSEIEVLIAVPESRMVNIQPNMPVTIKTWANQSKIYAGTVREIAPAADNLTRAFNVRVHVTAPDDAIKLGMTAGVTFKKPIDATKISTVFLIPNGALTEIDHIKTVWVIDANNKAQPREVSAGNFTEDGVVITKGLQAGEKIAVAGVHTLVKNQLVKPQFVSQQFEKLAQ